MALLVSEHRPGVHAEDLIDIIKTVFGLKRNLETQRVQVMLSAECVLLEN
jgi:hypothetical protein